MAGGAAYTWGECFGAEVDMRGLTWRRIASGVARWLCYAAVAVVLTVFGLRLAAGVGEVWRGEATPAEMLEELGDWLTGRE